MKFDFNKIICLGLFASFSCLSAQEQMLVDSSKEVTMSTPREGCPAPADCRGERFIAEPCSRQQDDYDYDVYTTGEGGREECEKTPAPCRRSCDNPRASKKSQCGDDCKRKGAAKSAQE